MNIVERIQNCADSSNMVESTSTRKSNVPGLIKLQSSAQTMNLLEINENTRGLLLMCDAGHLELSWDECNDREVKKIIERKMAGGMRFFRMQPVFGGLIDIKRRLASAEEITDYKFKIKDKDILELLNAGNARLFRNGNEMLETSAPVRDATQAVRTRTIGVPALAGG